MILHQVLQFVVSWLPDTRVKILNTKSWSNYNFSARQIPFRFGVYTDSTEAVGTPAGETPSNEQAVFPAGIIGFQLEFFQVAC